MDISWWNSSIKCHTIPDMIHLPQFKAMNHMGMGQNPIPLVNIKIAGKWMFIPLKMVLIGIDPYPYPVPCFGSGARSDPKNSWCYSQYQTLHSARSRVKACCLPQVASIYSKNSIES